MAGINMMALRQAVMANTPHTATANGSTASFSTDMVGKLRHLVVGIEPVQDLHGYDNPWPAGGSANRWDEEWETGWIGWAGSDADDPDKIRSKGFMPVSEGNVYRVVTSHNLQFLYYDSNKSFVSYEPSSKENQSTITIPAGCAYIRFYTYGTGYGGTYKNDIAINYPSTVTTYSPYSNICPITGWTGANVVRTGKNLMNMGNPDGVSGSTWMLNDDGSISVTTGQYGGASVQYIMTGKLPAGTYTCTNYADLQNCYCQNAANDYSHLVAKLGGTYTFSYDGSSYLRMLFTNQPASSTRNYSLQLELNSIATDYASYTGTTFPISWESVAGTVYGGTLDVVTGVLTVDRANVPINSITWTYNSEYHRFNSAQVTDIVAPSANNVALANFICTSYRTGPATQTGSNGINGTIGVGTTKNVYIRDEAFEDEDEWLGKYGTQRIVYPLATPQTYQLTPTMVKSLIGTNHVWADTGDVESLTYWTH